MDYIQETAQQINGLTMHTIQTDKFKTNTILIKFNAPLKDEDVTKRALLPFVLQSGTKTYPTTKQLSSYLDDLYGATLNVDLTKKGENHVITIRIDIANEKFLTDHTPLLHHALNLLSEIVLSPALEDGAFVKHIVDKEKRALKQKIEAVYDDKMRYANLRLVQEMCKDEPYRLHVNGELNDLDQITPKSLYDYYQKVLKEDQVDLYLIGDFGVSDLSSIKTIFSFKDRQRQTWETVIHKKIEKVNEIVENQNVKQGKLNIGYRTNTRYSDDDYFALQMFNGIFGGFSHSKLFINVREKASLAYYAASRVESHKGLLMVMSGVEHKNYQKAVTIIKEQMEAMKQGDFSDQEISQTKAVINNQLLETIDTPRGLVEVLYHNVVSAKKRTIEEWLKGIAMITKEQIVAVSAKIELDTIYFLTGTEGQE
jgi:predicted Zn-dependent peptidase